MTHRTELNPQTPIENATNRVIKELNDTITSAYIAFHINSQHQTSETEYRRILALYFHDKSLMDWCHDLGIQDATDPADTAEGRR